jgi:hypothetical protein
MCRSPLTACPVANVSWMGPTAVEAAFAERPDLAREFLPGSSERRAKELLIEHGLGDIGTGGGQGTTVAHQLPPVPDFVGRTRELQVLRVEARSCSSTPAPRRRHRDPHFQRRGACRRSGEIVIMRRT